jgi:hypothetical protein
VDLGTNVKDTLNMMSTNSANDIRAKALATTVANLRAKRELMKLELPDRWSDITGNLFGATPRGPLTSPRYPTHLDDRPTLSKIYLRRYESTNPSERFEGAECLYMIIMYACGDGEARTMFSARDIGDVDGDGAPEFLDGWGRPIHFVRWPAGFVSAMQPLDNTLDPPDRNPDIDHDPFDPFRVDPNAYRLVPLIFSSGPDGETIQVPGDIHVDYPNNNPGEQLNPYAAIYGNEENSNRVQLGTVGGPDGTSNAHVDDIHNHLQDR